MTAEEFLAKHGGDTGVELVRGRVVNKHGEEIVVKPTESQAGRVRMPGGKHGKACHKVNLHLGLYLMQHDLGHVFGNDTYIPTTEDPVSFRGSDVCYLSYSRWPKERDLPTGPIPVPELVVEVRSPTDRLSVLMNKAYEYLDAGVTAVVVLIPETKSAAVYRDDDLPPLRLAASDNLELPDILPGFSVPVKSFFE
jgi:Uma2 family endonuclease